MGWQPIESAPKDGSLIDLWCVHPKHGASRLPDAHWDDERGWTDELADLNEGWEATHWMPLPEPPGK